MIALWFAIGWIAAGPPAKKPRKTEVPAKVGLPTTITPGIVGDTKCSACHLASGWKKVTFAHDRTGFALRDGHTQVTCRACHLSDFATKVATTCAGCHRDVHTGEFGQQCEGCHDEASFRARFSVEAHRGTLFPLAGAHATLPCQECHAQARDRVFTKTATSCGACHEKDLVAASARSVDHSALPRSCQDCHSLTRFQPALFTPHEACFALAGTVHSAVACNQCHSSLTTTAVTGACATRTAACSACHTHNCARTDQRHAAVPGYQCKDQKCYECHRFVRK